MKRSKEMTEERWVKRRTDSDLIEACRFGAIEDIKRLLESGADASGCNAGGITPLHMASFKGDVRAIELLVKYGADPSVRKMFGTPLLFALREKHIDAVRALLEYGANPDNGEDENLTPLTAACHEQSLGSVKILLKFGADPNLMDSDGWTPLTRACQDGLQSIAAVLLESNADIEFKNRKCESPLDCACIREDDLVDLLLRSGACVTKHSIKNRRVRIHAFRSISMMFIGSRDERNPLSLIGAIPHIMEYITRLAFGFDPEIF